MSTEVPKIYRNVAAIIAIGLCCAASRMAFGADNPQPSVSDQPAAQDLEQSRAFDIFQKEIEPLLGREIAEESCQSCHEEGGTSQLVLPGTAAEDFRALLNGGYLFRDGPDTLLARILTKNPKTRMPKGKHAIPWTDEEIGKVKTFLSALGEVAKLDGHADEQFPADLLSPYTGPAPKSLDNQFITYWQLRGKVRTIFHDDWMRNGEDLFEKNIALFGGADFEQRFNETSKASASFLTGLEMLSRDVADRAYTLKNGPFDGRPDEMESPEKNAEPSDLYRQQIAKLYRAILYRAPTVAEEQQAYDLIRGVYRAKQEILSTDFDLAFALEVEDPLTGLKSRRTITLPISGEFHGLYQELIDESAHSPTRMARRTLAQKFQFKKGDAGQRFRLSNVNTIGNVSLSGIELRKTGVDKTTEIPVTDANVQAEGAWKISGAAADTSYDDANIEKGTSNIIIPIAVPEDGEYELTVLWRNNASDARDVLVEVFSQAGNTLAIEPAPAPPPKGEAQFHYDSSADDIPYLELPGVFRFADSDIVEINNTGTHDRVTASALRFVPQKGGDGFLVDSKEAEGFEKWESFDSGKFKAYNKVGTPVHDGGTNKGSLSLRFKPSSNGSGADGWKPDAFYRVQVNFPGKAGNELRVPLTIHATESSPIIQVVHPARARAESDVTIDASGSFTVQGSKLNYHWKQIDGPAVKISGEGPVLHFTAPRRNLQQAAWVALARGLIRHPDFVFTRPPSMEFARDPEEKRRLQLVKLALDLTGRPPTSEEVADLEKGASLEQMLDRYLQSPEFEHFYFHRIRLYLESHGTETQDEPARLWCYVAFNDRPIQQILTADFTVDASFQKQRRPAYHGHTGVLTTKGFIEGKPGLPHFNYAAQVAMLFLGYVFEVPPEVVEQRAGSTAASTVDPSGICYSCHKILTPIAMQRNFWNDDGIFRTHDDFGLPIDASDAKLVNGYPFAGEGLQAFATQAVKKERFIRTMVDTHVTFFFGRQMRWRDDERALYRRVWEQMREHHYTVRSLIRALLTSPEYIEGKPAEAAQTASVNANSQAHSPARTLP
jgi:hypothetical protein